MNKQFDAVIAAGVKLQSQLPWMQLVAVGGTATALHAGHRFSHDVDFVTRDLRGQFDQVLGQLDEWSEWKTNRVQRPVLILGEANRIELGLRQQRREKPIDSIVKQGLRIPTIEECFKIKAYLLAQRNAVRDFVDTCALLDLVGEERATSLLEEMDLDSPPIDQLSNTAHFAQNVRQSPVDLAAIDLRNYRGIQGPYDNWQYVQDRLRTVSATLEKKRLEKLPKGKIGHEP